MHLSNLMSHGNVSPWFRCIRLPFFCYCNQSRFSKGTQYIASTQSNNQSGSQSNLNLKGFYNRTSIHELNEISSGPKKMRLQNRLINSYTTFLLLACTFALVLSHRCCIPTKVANVVQSTLFGNHSCVNLAQLQYIDNVTTNN